MHLNNSDDDFITYSSKTMAKRVVIPNQTADGIINHIYYFNSYRNYFDSNKMIFWLMTEEQYLQDDNTRYYEISEDEYNLLIDYWENIEMDKSLEVIQADIKTAKKILEKKII